MRKVIKYIEFAKLIIDLLVISPQVCALALSAAKKHFSTTPTGAN
jgi:hypothetical protein